MTSKQTGTTGGNRRPPKATSTGKPRSFGEQWTSKGDAFTRSVSKTGHGALKTAKPKRAG